MVPQPSPLVPSSSAAARRSLARLFLEREIGQRIPPVQELQRTFGTGSGTVVKVLRELQDSGSVNLRTRGHQGTTLESRHVGRLWNEAGLGNFRLLMPPPGPVEQQGALQALKTLFEKTGVPLITDYVSGARYRLADVYHERSHAAFMSIGAFQNLASQHPGTTGIDLGPGSYYAPGSLVVVRRDGSRLLHRPKVGIDHGSYDHQSLTGSEFDHLDPVYVECHFVEAPALVLAKEIDAAIWHSMPTVIPPKLAGLTLEPLAQPASLAMLEGASHGALVTRTLDAATNAILRELLPLDVARQQKDLLKIASSRTHHTLVWPR